MTNQPNQPGDNDGLVNLALGLLAVAFAVGADLWAGATAAAWLTTRQTLGIKAEQVPAALKALPANLSNPAAAWPEPAASRLPGPFIYWPVTILLTAAVLFVLFKAWGVYHDRGDTLDKRKRLGVDTQPRFALRKDLKPLALRQPEPGRFLLGRAQTGQLLATEPHTSERTRRGRRPQPGPVMFVGPSRCGKTYAAINGINTWLGPAILSSVKTDLLDETIDVRAQLGEIKVYDPAAITGHRRAQWTPLRGATDPLQAERAASLLIGAAPGAGGENDQFWAQHGATLVGGLLWLAAVTDHTMTDVARWITSYDQPTNDNPGDVAPLLRSLATGSDAQAEHARSLLKNLGGIWAGDSRMASSFYVSARPAIVPWSMPVVQNISIENHIDLDWLTSGNNTLYLAAPVIDQDRMAPALGGLIGDLITQALLQRRRLDPELLIVLDEAANTPLTQLPSWASTVTSQGIQLVTIWQSKSQLDEIYGRDAETILTNSRSRIFFSGTADRSGLTYVNELIGREHQPGILAAGGRGSDAYDRANPTSVDVVPPNVLRQLNTGDAVLIHGNLPPVHLSAINRLPRRWRLEAA